MIENRKGYSCWSKEDAGCGFVVWKRKAGKNLPPAVVRELMEGVRQSREAGEEPGVGRTAKPVTGFKGRSGRTFRAKLKLEQDAESAKWRADFDEDWAREPRPEADASGASGDGAAAPDSEAVTTPDVSTTRTRGRRSSGNGAQGGSGNGSRGGSNGAANGGHRRARTSQDGSRRI